MSLFSKRFCKICRKPEAQCICHVGQDLIESPLSFVLRDAPVPEWHPYFDYRRGVAPQPVIKGTVVEASASAGGKGRL